MTNIIEIVATLNKQGYPIDIRIEDNHDIMLIDKDSTEEFNITKTDLANIITKIAEIINPYI